MNESLAVPAGLFRRSCVSDLNDRYVVYRMLNRMVTFRDSDSGLKVSGYVEEVYRDIFAGEVRLKVNGHEYRFKEPTTARIDGNDIVFVYGDAKQKDVSDKTLFREMRRGQFRETIADTISRITPRRVKVKRFEMGVKKPSRRKPFLMRGIAAEPQLIACFA